MSFDLGLCPVDALGRHLVPTRGGRVAVINATAPGSPYPLLGSLAEPTAANGVRRGSWKADGRWACDGEHRFDLIAPRPS